MASDFIAFITDRLGDLTVADLERRTGDRVRNVLYRHSKPPMATLHKWADALELNERERLEMLELADEAHGGGTIAAWIADYIRQAETDAATMRRQIATIQTRLDALETTRKS